ncbi:MAG: Y-family DNA polymerase [Alkalilacustris sp.]
MSSRRILSLWFPRLAAERIVRRLAPAEPLALAVVCDIARTQRITALSAAAEAVGLRPGQALRDAQAMCPGLWTRPADPAGEAAFLAALARWAGRFSPSVALSPPDGLAADLTGCAHLFGGEAALAARIATEAADLGLTLRLAIADTLGAAWALARHGEAAPDGAPHDGPAPPPPGRMELALQTAPAANAIAADARATRARAASRRTLPPVVGALQRIVPPGGTRAALAPLPLAGLRLPGGTAEALAGVGLRRIGDLYTMPRAALARRFGRALVGRLDQALGADPEPMTPTLPAPPLAVRLSLPDPIGLLEDLSAALDRMLPRLCARLAEQGKGARRLRLQAHRCDGGVAVVELGLARATHDIARMRPLLEMKLPDIEVGFGIDMMRLVAIQTEPVTSAQHRAPLAMPRQGAAQEPQRGPEQRRTPPAAPDGAVLDDLIGRLGARLGMAAITRLHPADSHIPEKAELRLAAAWSAPFAGRWPTATAMPRPARLLIRPELVHAPDIPALPVRFRWRGRRLETRAAAGPERIAPEWWLDDPAWRSGVRDYWRVETEDGGRLWLFYAHGGALSGGWFCHGIFD